MHHKHRSRRRTESPAGGAALERDVPDRPGDNLVFDRVFEVAVAARELEQVADTPGSARASAASLGCTTSALESLAGSISAMRRVALDELAESQEEGADAESIQRLGRLLYVVEQNLSFAAGAADLAREVSGELVDARLAADARG